MEEEEEEEEEEGVYGVVGKVDVVEGVETLEEVMVEKSVGRERPRMRMLRWGKGKGGKRII